MKRVRLHHPEVGRHLNGVVTGAGAVRPRDKDHLAVRHGHDRHPSFTGLPGSIALDPKLHRARPNGGTVSAALGPSPTSGRHRHTRVSGGSVYFIERSSLVSFISLLPARRYYWTMQVVA